MSTRSGALPIERTYLRRAWLFNLLVALAIAVVIALVAAQPTATRAPQPEPQEKVGRIVQPAPGPFTFNGNTCHQCQ